MLVEERNQQMQAANTMQMKGLPLDARCFLLHVKTYKQNTVA